MKPYFIEEIEETTSTSDLVRERAQSGAQSGLCIVARKQTAGRGRRGRSFFSPEGGLYMSVLLRPEDAPGDAVMATAAAAVAAAEAIEALSGRKALIKWVNDVLVDGRKVCGILTESNVEGGRLTHMTLGIGVNLEEPEGGFPKEIADIAGAVFPFGCGARRRELAEAVLDRFFAYYADLPGRSYMPAYRARSAVIGKTVTVLGGNGEPLEAVDIDDDAALVVRDGAGALRRLFAGEVSVRTSK